MKITVFGANGLTGRRLVQQALDAGHDLVAVTRHSADYPLTHERRRRVTNAEPAEINDRQHSPNYKDNVSR